MNNRTALESFHLRADVIRIINGPVNAQVKTLVRIREIVNNLVFWHHSQQLLDILEPITSAQKQSERDAAHIGLVAPRWNSIRLQWQRMEASGRYPGVDFNTLHSIFDTRRKQQVQVIHLVAWALDPKTTNQASPDWLQLSSADQDAVVDFLQGKCSEEDHAALETEWLEYRSRMGTDIYSSTSRFYKFENPRQSWLFASGQKSVLAPIALRILGCIANSVPSERSFSALNHIHSKVRGRLDPEKADKQTFCFMNSRTLERVRSDGRVAAASHIDDEHLEPQLIEIEQAVFDASAGAEMEGEEGGEDEE